VEISSQRLPAVSHSSYTEELEVGLAVGVSIVSGSDLPERYKLKRE